MSREIIELHLRTSLNMEDNEDLSHLDGNCEILLRIYDEEFESMDKIIGSIKFSLYNLSQYHGDFYSLIGEADGESGDKCKLISDFLHFLKSIEMEDEPLSFISIDAMIINEADRNQGWGRRGLNKFLMYSSFLNIDYVTLQPAPINEVADELRFKKIKKIAKFYEGSGFRCYQEEKYEPIMIFSEYHFDDSTLFSSNSLEVKESIF